MLARAVGTGGHRVAVVLGSGLSELARSSTRGEAIPYDGIEGMPPSTVSGHEGALYSGTVEGVPALFFAGRVHLYEGYDAAAVTWSVRAVARHGCDTVVLTNAAGGIAPDLEVGAVCLISDHLNLTGTNPLTGPHSGDGPRFPDMSRVYDPELRALASTVDPRLKEGVYAGLVGPSYETPAEVRMLATLGADLVGMSTVLEAIAARSLGLRVLGLSVVTNRAAGLSPEPLNHDEVSAAGRAAAAQLESILHGVLAEM